MTAHSECGTPAAPADPPARGRATARWAAARWAALGMPVEKAKDFQGARAAAARLSAPASQQLGLWSSLMAILSTVFSILGPKSWARPRPSCSRGSWPSSGACPARSIDFDYIGQILLFLAVLYVISSRLQLPAAVRHGRRRAEDGLRHAPGGEPKLARLPLKFFDARTHGEILSRVTNDVDNIANTLQQSVTQIITSVVTLIGVIIMMLTISPPTDADRPGGAARLDGRGR